MLGSPCSPCCTPANFCGNYLDAAAVEVDITGSDYVVSCQVNNPDYGAIGYGFPGNSINGSWSLTRESISDSEALWSTRFGGAICGVDYILQVRFFVVPLLPNGNLNTSSPIMSVSVEAPLIFNSKGQSNTSAYLSIADLCASGTPSFGAGNGLTRYQYCQQYNAATLPAMSVTGVPVVDTSDPFNRLVETCNPSRVNVGSYSFGITAVRVYR